MRSIFRRGTKCSVGQTMMEYLMITAIVVAASVLIFKYFSVQKANDAGEIINKPREVMKELQGTPGTPGSIENAFKDGMK